MVENRDAGKDQSSRREADPKAEEGVSVERAAETIQTAPVAPANHRPRWKRRLAMGVLATVVAALWKFGVPWIDFLANRWSIPEFGWS
jgi:hypothetical protein